MRNRHLALVTTIGVSLAAACGCSSPSSEADGEDQTSALINGTEAEKGTLGSVVRVDENCTGTQIGPRLLVTASHCIRTPLGEVSPSYAAGREILIEARDSSGVLVGTKIRIVDAKVHPRLAEVCAAENGGAGCQGSSAVAGRDAPDVAILKLAADIPNATITPISTVASRPDDEIVTAGFGCFQNMGGATDDKLRVGATTVLEPMEVAHLGAPLTAEKATSLSGVYLFTEGPGLRRISYAGLCQGDSGGPAFRRGTSGLVLVGVSSSYTFMRNDSTVPATNWFSRVDVFAKNEVFAWLEKQGAKFAH